MKITPFILLMGLWAAALCSCTLAPSLSGQAPEKQLRLELVLKTPDGDDLELAEGEQVRISKDEQVLFEGPIHKERDVYNLLFLSPLEAAPPYQLSLTSARVQRVSGPRIIPVGSQGGLSARPPVEIDPGSLPQDPNPAESVAPGAAPQHISLQTALHLDLQRAGHYLSPELIVELEEKDKESSQK